MKPSFHVDGKDNLKMTKHKYSVYGVFQMDGSLFSGTCVSDDIVKVIEMFREKGYSIWNIERKEQVRANEQIGIRNINILGGYSADWNNKNNIYGLYKQIMKKNPDAINKINTLEEAKQILGMITGNVYINEEIYESLDKICKKQEEI